MRPTSVMLAAAIATFVALPVMAQFSDVQLGKLFDEPPAPLWFQHLRVGGAVALNLKAKFSSDGQFTSSGAGAGETGVSGVDHVYDDGFVKVDASGNNGGSTWYWGYQNASQYDSGSQRLFFHSTDAVSTGATRGSADAGPQGGLDVAYGINLRQFGGGLLGLDFGFNFLPIAVDRSITMPATVTRSIYSFDASGVEKFPDAPYQGTFNGPGALINDVAQFDGTDTKDGTLTGKQELDVTLFSFRLGPTLHWELHPRWAVSVSAGAAVGIVTGDLKFSETISFDDGSKTSINGKESSTEIVYGGYVGGALMYHVEPHGDFYLGVQYMPLTDATFKSAGREGRLEFMGGIFISAGINWPF